MEFRTIQSSEIDNDAVTDRLRQLQSPADDAGLVAAGVALCCAVEHAGGDRMDIKVGGGRIDGAAPEWLGGWRVIVTRDDDAAAAEELCQTYRKKLLALCGVDSVRDDVPAMLDHLRGHLDNSIELSDDDVRHISALIDVLEFLLETEPTEDGAPSEKPGHV